MSIDRIGKGGAPPASGIPSDLSGTREITKGSEASEAFKVAKGDAVAPAATSLERLRSGEISIGQYLDLKVSEATAHLDGRLSSEQLEFVKTSLREQLSSDPVLADLVKAATGALPPSNE